MTLSPPASPAVRADLSNTAVPDVVRGYQIRAIVPSCRIRFLERMELLQAPHLHLQPAARRGLLDMLIRRMFKWPKPLRETMLDQFERWQA